jgi:hypothetical protein
MRRYNDVLINKIASCLGLPQKFLIFIGAKVFKLSIKHYTPLDVG